MIVLPIDLKLTDDPNYMVTVGVTTEVTTVLSGAFLIATFLVALKYRKVLKGKMVPICALLIFIVITVLVRGIKPELICLEFLATLAALIMYATLENPDQKMAYQRAMENRELKKLDDAKDDFISMASHQLRTPLTSVKGYVSMLLDGDFGKLTSKQRRILGEAYISSERMAFIIGDFLDLSRLQTGKFELEKTPTNLGEILDSEISQLKTTADSYGIKLVYGAVADLPIIDCDLNKIRQVMMNMIDNAIFYSHSGGKIEISLYQKNKKDIVFTVRDHGIGVPRAEQHKLFEKFFRASNARQARPDGTGVGLYMARKVIVAHGGSIIFESHENGGSTFGFRLPIESIDD